MDSLSSFFDDDVVDPCLGCIRDDEDASGMCTRLLVTQARVILYAYWMPISGTNAAPRPVVCQCIPVDCKGGGGIRQLRSRDVI